MHKDFWTAINDSIKNDYIRLMYYCKQAEITLSLELFCGNGQINPY